MKRIFSVALAVALVAGLTGAAMARGGGDRQQGPCGDCPQQSGQAFQGGGQTGQGTFDCNGPRNDAGRKGMRGDCDGPRNDGGRGQGLRSRQRDCDGPCNDGGRGGRKGDRMGRGRADGAGKGEGAVKAKVTLDEAKAQAKAFVDSSLKGATLKGVEEQARGGRFPHYVGTVEQAGKTFLIMIDAINGGVRGMRLLPSVSPVK